MRRSILAVNSHTAALHSESAQLEFQIPIVNHFVACQCGDPNVIELDVEDQSEAAQISGNQEAIRNLTVSL